MKEQPILFNSEMVRAILAGAKTQTRRVIKPQPVDVGSGQLTWKEGTGHGAGAPVKDAGWWFDCPYGAAGDRLWVRETFACVHGSPEHTAPHATDVVVYRADGGEAGQVITSAKGWKPSIFMPRAYSRLALEIIDVRAERVQDISREDARAEGILLNFHLLWDSINEKRGYSWDSNPWVWALTFRPV